MRIGVNLLFVVPGATGGMEIYVRQLLRGLALVDADHEYVVFRGVDSDSSIVPEQANFQDVALPVRSKNRVARLAYEQTLFLRDLKKYRIDVLFNGSYTAPFLCTIPMATVFYDFHYKHFGKQHGTKIELLVASVIYPASAFRSKAVVTMTKAVRNELFHFYPWTRGRVFIIPHSVDEQLKRISRIRSDAGSPATPPFILAASGLMVHKNFGRLLQAFAKFREEHSDVKLIVTGFKSRDTSRLETLRSDLHLQDQVEFMGWIPEESLLELFASTTLFVHTSLHEGFGIPVLEALTAGVPLVCSRIAPVEEIAGDAARFFDPLNVDDIYQALSDVYRDRELQQRLAVAGPIRAERFDLRENARKLLDVFVRLQPTK